MAEIPLLRVRTGVEPVAAFAVFAVLRALPGVFPQQSLRKAKKICSNEGS